MAVCYVCVHDVFIIKLQSLIKVCMKSLLYVSCYMYVFSITDYKHLRVATLFSDNDIPAGPVSAVSQ